MEELFKNSLLGQLKELGFGTQGSAGAEISVVPDIENTPNPLAIKVNGDIKDSPFFDNPIKKEEIKPKEPVLNSSENIENDTLKNSRKRLNDFDFDILQDSAVKKAQDKFRGSNVFGKFLFKYFPGLYKGFLLKKALKKLNVLNKSAKELLSKNIPYGESDERYSALIEYLSSANTIQAKLLKKI